MTDGELTKNLKHLTAQLKLMIKALHPEPLIEKSIEQFDTLITMKGATNLSAMSEIAPHCIATLDFFQKHGLALNKKAAFSKLFLNYC